MKKQFLFTFFVICLLSTFYTPLNALKSKPFKCDEDADAYLTEHYNKGCKNYNSESWRRASTEFEKVIYFFPSTDEAAMASYYLAVCYYEMKEYDFSNEEFSNYLKASQHPEFFEDAVYFKFCIAEHFKAGKKRRPFKMRYLPKWISAHESALEIYDEVVAALPNHELTIRALQSKAELLCTMGEYREAVEAYQLIIRRFPKNEIVPDCYLKIAETYLEQSRYEFQNPDILALAELNVRKFRDHFPRDERVEIVEETVREIKELYAKGLCDLGLFYERLEKPEAAAIYFQSSIEEFPDTRVARFCRARLKCLGYGPEEELPSPCIEEVNPVVPAEKGLEQEPPSCPQEQIVQPMEAEPTAVDPVQCPVIEPAQCQDPQLIAVPQEEAQWRVGQVPPQEYSQCEMEQAAPSPDLSEYANEQIPQQEPQLAVEQDPPQEYSQWEIEQAPPSQELSEYANEQIPQQEPQWEYEQVPSQKKAWWADDQVAECEPSTIQDNSGDVNNAPYYLHYSLLKNRKQNVAPQGR